MILKIEDFIQQVYPSKNSTRWEYTKLISILNEKKSKCQYVSFFSKVSEWDLKFLPDLDVQILYCHQSDFTFESKNVYLNRIKIDLLRMDYGVSGNLYIVPSNEQIEFSTEHGEKVFALPKNLLHPDYFSKLLNLTKIEIPTKDEYSIQLVEVEGLLQLIFENFGEVLAIIPLPRKD